MNNNNIYVIFKMSKHGLTQCRVMSEEDILRSAEFELNQKGISFDSAVAKLGDNGRSFQVYTNAQEFEVNAQEFGLLLEAKVLVKNNKRNIILSNYKYGSDGNINLFWSPTMKCFVIQWEGEPEFDSGYSEDRFDDLFEASAYFIKYYGDAHIR